MEFTSIPLDGHAELLSRYNTAAQAVKYWENELAKAKEELAKVMGDATSGTVEGREVVTYRTVDRFRGADFKKAYPDTYRLYTTTREVTSFDVDMFRQSRPDLYAQFQVRAFRAVTHG
jgi:hypothetical protein